MIKRKSVAAGTIILTLSGLITMSMDFAYRIYLSNLIGAEGMGLYQLILPLYFFVWTIAGSGVTTTITKLVAEENAKNEYGNMSLIVKAAIILCLTLAAILSIYIFFGAEFIARFLLHEERTVLSVKIISFAMPFMAVNSCIKGYFYGLMKVEVTAVSQIIDHLVRISGLYVLSQMLIPLGISYACSAAVLAIVCGEISELLFTAAAYRRFNKKQPFFKTSGYSFSKSLSVILTMLIPLTLNRMTGAAFYAFENTLIPGGLQAFGMTRTEAISTFGRITGMAMPLIYFPTALLTSLSVSLVTAVSEGMAVKNYRKMQSAISKSIQLTMLIGFGAAALFFISANELGRFFYKQHIPEMMLLGVMSPLWYMNITVAGILNGLGKQLFIFENNVMTSVINIGIIFFLVPLYGVNALIFGWFLSQIISVSISVWKIKQEAKVTIDFSDNMLIPFLGSIATVLIVRLLYNNVLCYLSKPIMLLTCLCITAAVYFGLMIFQFADVGREHLRRVSVKAKPRR